MSMDTPTGHPLHRSPTLVAAMVVALVLVAPVAQAQNLEIASGPAVAPEYTMRVDVSGFDLVDYRNRDTNRDGQGHIHYLVNGEPATDDMSYATPSTTFTFTGLGVGDTVGAQLVNNDHSPVEPEVKATQEVGAGTPGFTGLAVIFAIVVALGAIRHRSS